MEPDRDTLLPIGAFARLTYLTIKALRLYAQLGLLVPVHVDAASGYRYYHPEQVQRARLIRLMRAMQMPLGTIRVVLSADAASAALLTNAYVQELEERAVLARRLAPGILATLSGEPLDDAVTVRDADAQLFVSVTHRVRASSLVPLLQRCVQHLTGTITQLGAAPAGPPFGIYHGQINHEEDGPIEVCLPIPKHLDVKHPLAAKELPPTRLAVIQLRGEQCQFPAILQGYDAVHDWIARRGFVHAGPPREVWLEPPAVANPNDRIELAWPFQTR
jgi:DNA-binding transcriptional MerR regulator